MMRKVFDQPPIIDSYGRRMCDRMTATESTNHHMTSDQRIRIIPRNHSRVIAVQKLYIQPTSIETPPIPENTKPRRTPKKILPTRSLTQV